VDDGQGCGRRPRLRTTAKATAKAQENDAEAEDDGQAKLTTEVAAGG
jgi:hypothetical protein